MKVRVHDARHFGTIFGSPLFLADSDMAELSACPACGDASRQSLVSQSEGSGGRGLCFSECGECGHGYLSRRPSAEWYQRYYSTEWDTGRGTTNLVKARAAQRAAVALKRVPGLRRVYRGLRHIARPPDNTHSLERENLMTMLTGIGNAKGMKFLPRAYRVLEIGSGYGGALAIFKELGFDAVGTEASSHRVQSCRMQGLDVVETSIEDVSELSKRGPFDLVYSSHVFEHLLDPSLLMTQLAPMVVEGGYVCIEVPNTCVAEGLLKLLHYPYHCHAFSASSLVKLLDRHGFKAVRVHMDVNLHVVACKGITAFDFPDFAPHSNVSGLLRGNGSWVSERGKIRVVFDDFDVRIEREDGPVLHQRSRPYATKPLLKNGVSILGREFLLEVEDLSEPSLIRWVHPTLQSPIWMKYQ